MEIHSNFVDFYEFDQEDQTFACNNWGAFTRKGGGLTPDRSWGTAVAAELIHQRSSIDFSRLKHGNDL